MEMTQQRIDKGYQSLKFTVNEIPEIEAIELGLYDALSDSKGVIRDMCIHILEAGGKRVRPLLVLYSGLAFTDVSEELINAAVAAELIHMASLVHDDIIDKSDVRRSRPSINKIWGSHYAVLCGDYLFAKAFKILSDKRLIKSLGTMVRAIETMCGGEIEQAENRFNCGVNTDIYYDRVSSKTAFFLECCCRSGAYVANADEDYAKALGDYGLNIGYAFQVIDDILDFCGKEDLMGKPVFEDIKEGNITLPLIMLLNDISYGEWIRETIINRSFESPVMDKISAVMKETGIITKCNEIAAMHIEMAKESIGILPSSPYKVTLINLADMLKHRAN